MLAVGYGIAADLLPPAGHDVLWIALDRGAVHVSGEIVPGEIVAFAEGAGSVTFRAVGEVDLILGSAERHPYPLVLGSYSVHTHAAALEAGQQEIRAIGKMLKAAGKI